PFSLMYHGITYADEAENEDDKGQMTVRFWQPQMKNGVIDFIQPKDCTVKRHIHGMDIKPFGKEYENFCPIDEDVTLGGDESELG
ncbi:MAG: type I-C CRISPR-associated protein Cas5, partial [Oscillospiraceae bacterium]